MVKRLALIIATNNYQDKTLSRLKTPTADVEALASLLGNPAIGNFNPAQAVVNSPAREVRRHIYDLFQRRMRHDVLLLYFLGHGLVDEAGQLYLATADTALDCLRETAIPAAYITGCMDRSFSRQQILILDCYYAEVGRQARPLPDSTVNVAAAFEGTAYRRMVLAGSDAIHYVLRGDEPLGQAGDSVFTHYLIQGLQTGRADMDRDEQVGLGELYEYIHTQIARHSADQKPRKWSYKTPDEFIIARSLKSSRKEQAIKWDLIFGAIMAPLTTIAIGWSADRSASVGLAGMFLLLYAFLYWILD